MNGFARRILILMMLSCHVIVFVLSLHFLAPVLFFVYCCLCLWPDLPKFLQLTPHICPFWYTTTVFRLVKVHRKVHQFPTKWPIKGQNLFAKKYTAGTGMLQLPLAVSLAGNCLEHKDGRHNNVVDENVFTHRWQSWWCLHNDGRHNNVVDGNLFARRLSTSLGRGCLAQRHARQDLDQRHPHQLGGCHKNLINHLFSIDALHTFVYGWR